MFVSYVLYTTIRTFIVISVEFSLSMRISQKLYEEFATVMAYIPSQHLEYFLSRKVKGFVGNKLWYSPMTQTFFMCFTYSIDILQKLYI